MCCMCVNSWYGLSLWVDSEGRYGDSPGMGMTMEKGTANAKSL